MKSLGNDDKANVDRDFIAAEVEGYEIDQLDLKIIKCLQRNGRVAYSDIARTIESPEATIRYRVKRLLDEAIITISAFINAGKVKHENVAYLELEVEAIFFEASLSDLMAMENISYIASVTGEFNLMMEYIYKDNNDLLSFLNSLKSNPGIMRLNSRTILKIHKAQYPAKVEP
ncbi:MAG: AsnC family transcriptional regulator [Cyanobacteria bacterium]|nr:AsnC family transcriptional regulator [Cyanobacteriota bacterium]MDA0865556.1 AsnC family transcriptional regulator [Cyanobacteriota bacterium]